MPLTIFDSDKTTLEPIKQLLGDSKQVNVFVGNGPSATANCNLDALWVTAMQGERFGLPLNLAPGQCVIRQNRSDMLAKGLPRQIISCGTNLDPDWLKDAVRAVTQAILDFNRERPDTEAIRRVGTIPENLAMTPANAASVVAVLKAEWKV